MKKSTKIAIIVASALLLMGIIVGMIGLSVMGFDLTEMDMSSYETREYEISDDFDSIRVDTDTADLNFKLSDDGICRVVGYESKRERYSVSAENGTLVITSVDNRKWYNYIGFSFADRTLDVYLPKAEYASLYIESDTGDIELPKEFIFENASVESDTGDICWYAAVSGELSVSTDTGEINMSGVSAKELILATDTGDIKIDSSNVNELLQIKSDTGDITVESVISSESFDITSSTGDVEIILSDAKSLKIKTSTGDVYGTLLTDKTFITDTSTGKVSVPKATVGGECDISTSTGDIEFSIIQ